MQTTEQISHTEKTRMQEFTSSLREHLYRTKLVCYSLLLVVGVTQIVIREHFPNLNPPWPIIAIALMIVLFGILLVPPFLAAIRVSKKAESPKGETNG
jgi:hypothetical protein